MFMDCLKLGRSNQQPMDNHKRQVMDWILPEWWQFFSLLHQLEKMLNRLLSQWQTQQFLSLKAYIKIRKMLIFLLIIEFVQGIALRMINDAMIFYASLMSNDGCMWNTSKYTLEGCVNYINVVNWHDILIEVTDLGYCMYCPGNRKDSPGACCRNIKIRLRTCS